MDLKTVLCINQTDFENVDKLRKDGWTIDPAAKSSGPMATAIGVVYHLVKYSAEELQAIAQSAELATNKPALAVEDFVALPIEATKAEPGSESLIKKYLDAGYVVDDCERVAAKSTKTVNLYKPKAATAPAQLQAIPIKVDVQVQAEPATPAPVQAESSGIPEDFLKLTPEERAAKYPELNAKFEAKKAALAKKGPSA